MKKLKIFKGLKRKLIIWFLILSIVPSAVMCGLSYNNSKKSLQQQTIDQLSFLRDTKKKEIEDYFKTSRNRISYMAQEPMTIQAMSEFNEAPFNSSAYNTTYDKYHSVFTNFVNKLEYGDMLFVDIKTGNIVYSTFKEGDYGTNLLTGTYKNTSIAKSFEGVKNSSDRNFTIVTDYEFYKPSNDKPILGIAAPIFKGEEKIGVLIFKVGTNKIDQIISNDNKWETLNVGKSGDLVLIGDDYKLRSNTRFLSEEKDEKIKVAKSATLLKEVKTKGTEEAISGKSGIESYNDYRNNLVISAYAPLNIDNLKWGLVVKMDETEAFHTANRLKNIMIVILIIAIILITVFSFIMASSIAKPIIKLSKVAFQISEGDLTVELPEENRSDEIGILMKSTTNMLSNLRHQTKEIINVVNVLAASVSQITVSLTQVTSAASETSSAVSETTATVEEVKQTVYLSSEKTKNVSNGAKQSVEISKTGNKATEDTVDGMNIINIQMQAIAESIIALSTQSQNISELIESVDNISEQSNILAVNASIEAAKAGEHGKGFSVVAQEIRNLADQSKEGTRQVRSILKDIQKATNTAVMTTEKGIKLVDIGVKRASEAGESIQKLMENISISAQAAVQIEASSQQQLIGMDQVALAMEGINQASIQNVDSMKQLEEATHSFKEMGDRLKQLTEKYKV